MSGGGLLGALQRKVGKVNFKTAIEEFERETEKSVTRGPPLLSVNVSVAFSTADTLRACARLISDFAGLGPVPTFSDLGFVAEPARTMMGTLVFGTREQRAT